MSIQVYRQGLEQALHMVEQAQFRINTPWVSARPSPDAEDAYIAAHGLEAYGAWHLALDTTQPETSKTRYLFPYGDFKSVHHTGVRSIKSQAERVQNAELIEAAEAILDIFDRFTAC